MLFFLSFIRRHTRCALVTGVQTCALPIFCLAAIFAPWIATHDPMKGSIIGRLKEFGYKGHILGTDETGRDLFSRLVYGARLTLLSGVAPVFFALLIGGFLGIAAGYFRGWANTLLMRGMAVLYETGRGACREGVGKDVWISVGAV